MGAMLVKKPRGATRSIWIHMADYGFKQFDVDVCVLILVAA
jgi:hypothetical protein